MVCKCRMYRAPIVEVPAGQEAPADAPNLPEFCQECGERIPIRQIIVELPFVHVDKDC